MLSFKRALIWSTRQSGLLPTMQWPAGLHPPSIPPRISFNLNQVHLVTLHSCSFSIDTQHAAATAGRQRVMKLCTSSNCPTQAQHTIPITNYQLPNDPVKAGRRWGQRHPQGANLGSNGILNFLSKLKQWLPPAHPKSLASQCMSGQPISTCHALTS